MASNIQTTIVHYIGQAGEKYVLMAILAGVIALITDYFGLGGIAAVAFSGALIAGLSAATAQYASTKSVPGTAIPLSTLLHLAYGALIVVIGRFAFSTTTWTEPAIAAAVVLFLSTLLQEVGTVPNAPTAGATTPATAAGPPAPGT